MKRQWRVEGEAPAPEREGRTYQQWQHFWNHLSGPSAEWRWKTGTKQESLTGCVIPGPWIQRNSSSDLGNFA